MEKEEWLDFKDLKVIVLHGPKKNQLVHEKADFYVITPEAIDWFTTKLPGYAFSPMAIIAPEMLVVDESSKFKNSQSARFLNLRPFLHIFDRRYTLTGSPAPNGYVDVFGQVYITDMGAALGSYVTHFRKSYFEMAEDHFGVRKYTLKDGAAQKIEKAIIPVVYRVDSEQYLDLPEFVPHPIYLELPKNARKIYDEMEEEFFAKLDRGEDVITAVNGAVARGKCCQVANGGIYLDAEPGKPREDRDIHTAKVDEVMELRESLGGKQLLIAYDYQHDFRRLQKALGNVPYIGGGVSPKRCREIIQDWNAGNIQDLLGHPASMSHGLNMQKSACEHICWHSLTDNFDNFDQFNKRIRRQGNKASHVWLHLLIARDTFDIVKWANLQNKGTTQQSLLDAIKAYRKTRQRKK